MRPLLLFVLCINFLAGYGQGQVLQQGLKISTSASFKNKTYTITAPAEPGNPVLRVEGNDIVVDFKNATLIGNAGKMNPDEFSGIALLVENSKKVTIRNLKIRGYKIALLARNVEELVLENCDFSYNYRQHLNSTPEKEDLSDWMSYHHNEKDEWLRYGAAMYLRNCNKAVIRNCKVTGGQNALMMMECNDGMIYNNDFSFNSGIGIGLYMSSRNQVLYNRLIFNVRGYSDGVYHRGQDSAGILVYEQSNGNLFYKNNVTHSGDGFFLWAGQITMDNGQGGCNDNMIRGNDFSYAPTNGIEVTFSRNSITDNRIFECDNGIWGGYSYESVITNNKFRNNKTGIAIEHGQQNKIAYNIFYRDRQAIHLWGRDAQPPGWGYAKYRDTRSRDYTIAFNNFNSNELVFDFNHTDSVRMFNNIAQDYGQLLQVDSTVSNLDTSFQEDIAGDLAADTSFAIPAIPVPPANPFKNSTSLAGKKNILITPWGPYDFRSPVIWNTNPNDTSDVLMFSLKGPAGKWRIKSYRGVDSFSRKSGSFPETITAKKTDTAGIDIFIQLEYTGPAITTPFGDPVPRGRPWPFSFQKFFRPIDWTINWFNLDTSVFNPLKTNQLFAPNVRVKPVKTEQAQSVDYVSWDGLKVADTSYTGFITMAEGSGIFEKGKYELAVTWDDAVRVYVDNKLVIDEWDSSQYQDDESRHKKIQLDLAGNHAFRLEHLNLSGFSVLSLTLNPVRSPVR